MGRGVQNKKKEAQKEEKIKEKRSGRKETLPPPWPGLYDKWRCSLYAVLLADPARCLSNQWSSMDQFPQEQFSRIRLTDTFSSVVCKDI